MKRLTKTILSVCAAASLSLIVLPFSGCATDEGDEVVLRVSSWEEYIDLGGWDEEERIDIVNPFLLEGSEETGIIGVNEMVDDFEEWFLDEYGYKVKVEYSTFGTNEDLNNRMNLGDVYDLVCPSDYLIMQLIRENKVKPYSHEFFDPETDNNFYAKYASAYIKGVFEGNSVKFEGAKDDEPKELKWSECAACYMWGTT
ncbi:MAG: spermidine/putrescine ABC transporter substrate-binding protein, partial [Clostridia bacterium]|nr:spermidine/putrescine ABC transporter substrate-binding protein [Clostridia bacterium]